MNNSKTELINGVDIGSVVLTSYHGVRRYGKVIEIDNSGKDSSKGNVLVEYFNQEIKPESRWHWGWDVAVLTPQNYEQRRHDLQLELDELRLARIAAMLSLVSQDD